MANDRDDVVWLHAEREISIRELAECCRLSESEILELVECGALAPRDAAHLTFAADCLGRLRAAARLRSDLELDPSTLAILLSLLERIHLLETEIRALAAGLPVARR